MKNALTQERLKELLHYDPCTGIFTYSKARKPIIVGSVAGCINGHGYRQIMIDYRFYQEHRLAWLYVHGRFPSSCIDHIDGDRLNNAISNLREATHAENCQNKRKAQNNNVAATLGVRWRERQQKWSSRITVDGNEKHLGLFETKELAHAAYLTAKAALHPFGTISNEVTE